MVNKCLLPTKTRLFEMNLYETQDKDGDCICLQLARSKQDALDIAREFHGDSVAYAETLQINSGGEK